MTPRTRPESRKIVSSSLSPACEQHAAATGSSANRLAGELLEDFPHAACRAGKAWPDHS
jgi:hypothetical protein